MAKYQLVKWASLLVVAGASILSGCDNPSMKQHSQVVARVNDQDVTVLQLNEALQSAGADATPEAIRAAVDSLVSQELLVQQAMKAKLDRDPAIVQALEQGRRQILAQAYAEKSLYPKQPIGLSEEETYYKAHPALFENRKLYRIMAFTVQSTDLGDRLSAELDKARSADEVRDVLEKREIKFETQQLNSAAEELPLDKVDQFAKARVGDLLVMGQHDGRTVLMAIVSADERPLSFEHAKPLIDQYLITVRNAQATDAYLERAKATAKIIYSPKYIDKVPQSVRQTDWKDPGESTPLSIASTPAQSSGAKLD